MTKHNDIHQEAQIFFEDLWKRGDPWELETSQFERERYACLFAHIRGRRYVRALEIGCGAGSFTRLLAGVAERVVALDISSSAIERAKAAQAHLKQVEFHVANVMDYNLKENGPWDLIVISETIYLLGWLYSFFDICWLASELFAATRDRGELLLANAQGEVCGPLLHRSIIRTYHDLLSNVGYKLKTEEVYRGVKNGVDIEVLISLFIKS